MYLEVKAIMSVMAMIFIAFVISQLILLNFLLSFLLIIALMVFLMGDIFIMYKITTTDCRPIMEPTPKGMELMELQLIDGSTRFMNTTKGAHGERKFYIHKHNASIINDGKAQFRLRSGNVGFRGHEFFDQNVDPKRCKALEQMPGDNIKELYTLTKGE